MDIGSRNKDSFTSCVLELLCSPSSYVLLLASEHRIDELAAYGIAQLCELSSNIPDF